MNFQEKIDEEQSALKNATSNSEKAERLNNIIQLKLQDSTEKFKSEIYVDMKNFISTHIHSLEEKKYYYDDLKLKNIETLLLKLDIEQAIKLQKYLIRTLKLNGYEEFVDLCIDVLQKFELRKELVNISISNSLKVLYLISTYSGLAITLTFTLMTVTSIVILLPAPSWSNAIVTVSYFQYTENFLLNHVLNVISGPLSVTDQFRVIPTGIAGFFLVGFAKLVFLLEIIGVLYKKFERKITAS